MLVKMGLVQGLMRKVGSAGSLGQDFVWLKEPVLRVRFEGIKDLLRNATSDEDGASLVVENLVGAQGLRLVRDQGKL